MTQKALAQAVGIGQPSLSDIEKGRSVPREATRLAIARVLDDDLGDTSIAKKLSADKGRNNLDAALQPLLWFVKKHEFAAVVATARLAEISPILKDLLGGETVTRLESLTAGIQEIVSAAEQQPVQDLGTVDEFDLDAAVARHSDPVSVMMDWYRHDGVPESEMVIPVFTEWEKFTPAQKAKELRTFREILKRQKKRRKHALPPKTA